MEKISIIVPCYNVEKQIDRCVTSIINQTIGLEHLEIILVNDASTDRTYEKLCEWEQKYPEQIMVINLPENMRQGGARNVGLSYASGEYIGFVDADDWIDAEMYAELYQVITGYSCEVASCRFVRETEAGEVVRLPKGKREYSRRMVVESIDDRKHYLQAGMPGGIWSKLYQRAFIMDNELFFPEHIAYEDNYWCSMLSFRLNSYVIIDKELYHYMVNTDSTTLSVGTGHLDRLKIEMMKIEEYQKRGYFEIYHDEIEHSFLKLYWCNTLAILFTRFLIVPKDLIDLMQRTVKSWFPNYRKNPYIDTFNGIDHKFLRLIEVELTEEQINQYAAVYRAAAYQRPDQINANAVDDVVKQLFLS